MSLRGGYKFYGQSTRITQKEHPALELVITTSPWAWLLCSKWEGLSSLSYTEKTNVWQKKKSSSGAFPLLIARIIMVSSLVKDLQFPFFFSSHPVPCIFKATYVTHTHAKLQHEKAATSNTTSQISTLHLFQALIPSLSMCCKLVCKLCKLEARAEWKPFSLALAASPA